MFGMTLLLGGMPQDSPFSVVQRNLSPKTRAQAGPGPTTFPGHVPLCRPFPPSHRREVIVEHLEEFVSHPTAFVQELKTYNPYVKHLLSNPGRGILAVDSYFTTQKGGRHFA